MADRIGAFQDSPEDMYTVTLVFDEKDWDILKKLRTVTEVDTGIYMKREFPMKTFITANLADSLARIDRHYKDNPEKLEYPEGCDTGMAPEDWANFGHLNTN